MGRLEKQKLYTGAIDKIKMASTCVERIIMHGNARQMEYPVS